MDLIKYLTRSQLYIYLTFLKDNILLKLADIFASWSEAKSVERQANF